MLLSEIDGFETKVFMFVKFIKKEWIDSFLDGNMYMNNFKYFIDQENSDSVKGQGDAFEGAHVIKFLNATAYTLDENGSEIKLADVESAALIERDPKVNKFPMFCLTCLGSHDYIVLEKTENIIKFKLNIPEEDKNKIKDTFNADIALVSISPFTFISRFRKVAEKLGCLCAHVRYEDFKVYDTLKRENFIKGTADILFSKEVSLSYQKEFRFVLSDVQSDVPFNLELGNLRDIFTPIDINDFFDETYIMVKK